MHVPSAFLLGSFSPMLAHLSGRNVIASIHMGFLDEYRFFACCNASACRGTQLTSQPCVCCRLDLLRKLVPHAERANTACFLEEVIKYIDSLKRRNSELEAQLASLKGSNAAAAAAQPSNQDQTHHEHHVEQAVQPETPSGQPALDGASNPLALLSTSQPFSASAALSALGQLRFDGGSNAVSTLLEQALLQNAINQAAQQAQQHAQQHAAVAAAAAAVAAAAHQKKPASPPPYGSTLPPELQRMLLNDSAVPTSSAAATAPTSAPAAANTDTAGGSHDRHRKRDSDDDGESALSSEESGVPLKKRKMLVL